ncbi:LysR family transcriptional regulator [Catenulispora subtropica]|uniref:HTH lysR-type domain-containing protein n=1 Tax=Catenulispora subtropica TaxID=450798 RepID=A0ABP5ESY1_9ACTN
MDSADLPAPLLDATFDQLRTLTLVHDTGSALRAARVLEREQSSVQKQLDTLNRAFQRMCGEQLVLRSGRGKDFRFTPTGEAVVALTRRTLADWSDGVHAIRRRLGSRLTVGTTELMLPFLAGARERIAESLDERGVQLHVVHIRTSEFAATLEANEVDVVCGSMVVPAGGTAHREKYDVVERYRSRLVLLTNLPVDELPDAPVSASRLATVPLALPSHGLVVEFLSRWYGPAHRDRLTTAAEISDLTYGFSLLTSGLVSGCVLVTEGIAHAAATGALPAAAGLRRVRLGTGFTPDLELLTGAFSRRGERSRIASGHPLALLWSAFEAEVAANTPGVLAGVG